MRHAIRYDAHGFLVTFPVKAGFTVNVTKAKPAGDNALALEGKVVVSRGAPPVRTAVRLTVGLDLLPETAGRWPAYWIANGLNMFVRFETDAEATPRITDVKNDPIRTPKTNLPRDNQSTA